MEAATLLNPDYNLLIVDDEPLMTELFEKLMSKRGFAVVSAAGGEEALRMMGADDTVADLVITDMTMPQMDGLALAAELLRRYPKLPVMLATGHDADMSIAAGLPNVVSVVRKPYQHRALAETIRSFLNANQGAAD
jgi:two-component system cell cycle sensor histidine kinase/response regulator CckA